MKTTALTAVVVALTACGDPGGENGNEDEVITTITLTFTATGMPAVVAEFDDPDGDGGEPPTIDPITLLSGGHYMLTVAFENRLEMPPEVITDEVRDEGDQHQVFFTGSYPLSIVYRDMDVNGLPIGLTNEVDALGEPGIGQLTVTLRHMPPINDKPVKTACAAMEVKTGGFAAIGGSTDAQATFEVTVQ